MSKKVSIVLEIDEKGNFKGRMQANRKELEAFGRTAETQSKKTVQAFSKTRKGLESISNQLAVAKKELIGFFAISNSIEAIRNTISLSDAYKSMQGQINLATQSADEFLKVQRSLVKQAFFCKLS